jgi:hypothetical protein
MAHVYTCKCYYYFEIPPCATQLSCSTVCHVYALLLLLTLGACTRALRYSVCVSAVYKALKSVVLQFEHICRLYAII